MTPRERDTLETILRNVQSWNYPGVIEGARIVPVVLLGEKGVVHTGDLVIESVRFKPTGAQGEQCA